MHPLQFSQHLSDVSSACTPRARALLMYLLWFRRAVSCSVLVVCVGLISPPLHLLERFPGTFQDFSLIHESLFSQEALQSPFLSPSRLIPQWGLCISPLACLSPRPFPSRPLPHHHLPTVSLLVTHARSPPSRGLPGWSRAPVRAPVKDVIVCWRLPWCGNGRTYWV